MRTYSANYLEAHADFYNKWHKGDYNELIEDALQMGLEADGLSVGPLQVALKIYIDIQLFDREQSYPLQLGQMKISGNFPIISVLFTKGHYDILYKKVMTAVDGFNI